MAHFWIQEGETGAWRPAILNANAVTGIGQGPLRLSAGECPAEGVSMQVLLVEADGLRRWVLLVASGTRALLNGRRLISGIRGLRDRDELLLGESRLFFSTEERPAVVSFEPPGADRARKTLCARCKVEIPAGFPAVRCPGCGAWHHQDEAAQRPCWSYAAQCGNCAHPTVMAADFQWSPEGL